MKKTIAVLIALMLAVSCLSLTAFAQEENEMVPAVKPWNLWQRDGTISGCRTLFRM